LYVEVSGTKLHIGIAAGETSGDILGGAVAGELRTRYGDQLTLSGIGGTRLAEQGLDSLYPMDRLSVFGIVEPLKRLPELLKIRRHLCEQQLDLRPDCFLGIDSPDFNLGVESRLRQKGVRTAHLVSPSVWAWRAGRIKHIAQSVDLMLCLLPFEVAVYQEAGVAATCVGHPLIEELAALPAQDTLRERLGISQTDKVLAVLPGSRSGEIAGLMPVYVQTMQRLHARHPELRFLIPAANTERQGQIEAALESVDLPVTVVLGRGRETMAVADAVLLASGTATLEAMLLRKPMVIAYRMHWLSWQILSRLAITRFVGLPNVLAGRAVVPELLQAAATPEALADAVQAALERGHEDQVVHFDELAGMIGGGFAPRVADAIDGLAG
jgi:lipid-A-disaccharide synthase